MSESLTLDEAELNILETGIRLDMRNLLLRDHLLGCISMARRSLQLEERLGKAVEALREAEAGLEFAGAESMKDVGTFVRAPNKALLFVRNVLIELESPEGVRPPVPATPPVEPDALPAKYQVCKHGPFSALACKECEAEDELIP